MCGIAGIVSSNTSFVNFDSLRKMTELLTHRGPDGEGHWISASGNAGLGHRRLSIIDLTDAGAQPMIYLQRYSIIHNGEIYNYIELKEQLEQKGYAFHSHSDTEVILAAFDLWKENCLQYFDGMFSFAIWDEKENKLFAARDRFGEKPFYYSIKELTFYFSSEMKGLWAAGADRTIINSRLLNYLALGWVENPTDKSETFYENIFSLPPAHYLYFQPAVGKPVIKKYWSLQIQTYSTINEAAAIEQFRHLFTTSLKRRLRSDVSVGTSLSGGLDSSSIVSFILQLPGYSGQLKSFSATFPGFANDESAYIQMLVMEKGINNFQTSPNADDCLNQFEKLLYHQEEPFTSSSVFAQFKVFELAKQHNVTVLLDGQGADETQAGYQKYYHWFWQELYLTNANLLKEEIKAATSLGIKNQWGLSNKIAARFPSKAAHFLEKRELKKLTSNSFLESAYIRAYYHPSSVYKPVVRKLNDILNFNATTFGLEELLRYADRNSMAHGCETRLPFLSHELVEFIFSLPSQYKIHNGWTKWLLRKTAETILPKEIAWRKDKTGFEPPQKSWMENSRMQEYIHESKKKLATEKILKASALDKKIQPADAHTADNFDWRFMVAAGLI